MPPLTKGLIFAGLGLIGLGLLAWILPLGRLPGDVVVRKPGFQVYFPWVSSLLLSLLLSAVFYLFGKK